MAAAEPASPAEPPVDAQQPADPIPFRQKGQLTGQDARAERLVLGVRSEVSELRNYIASLREHAGEAFAIDLESVIADPALAVTIPPRLFLDELLRQRDQVRSLEDALAETATALADARTENHELSLRLAVADVRRETLGDVIAALHANLEDLRAMRIQAIAPQQAAPQVPGPGR